jgi:methylthioribose-1-phosphate isomerase
VKNQTLEAIVYSPGKLKILDQKKLPFEFVYEDCKSAEAAFELIRSMKVRGAPAIAITAALGLAVDLYHKKQDFKKVEQLAAYIKDTLVYLGKSRPTAVNLFDTILKLTTFVNQKVLDSKTTVDSLMHGFTKACEAMLQKDISDNKAIGKFGAEAIVGTLQHQEKGVLNSLNVLTHCNTGSLATAGYGTALGIIRSLNEKKLLSHAYCTETRPYNQGARLTAFELVYESIPSTLITDSMASFLMKKKNIHAVVVGADRVVNNGDTANKIGTYQLAIAAKYHGVPFFVAAPLTSLDLSMQTGDEIPVEERPKDELTHISGVEIAAQGIGVWNPGFDITPGSLISGIVTEQKVIFPEKGLFDLRKSLK